MIYKFSGDLLVRVSPLLISFQERQLSPVEQRIAATLNNTVPDSHLTADSKEFRNLLHHISAMASSTTATPSTAESANTSGRSSILSEPSDTHIRYQNQPLDSPIKPRDLSLLSSGTNSVGRARPFADDLKSRGPMQHYCAGNRLQTGPRLNGKL